MADQNLKIRISAIDTTKAAFDKIARRLNKVRRSLMNFKTALLAAGGTAGMIYLVKSSMDGIDKVSKLSRTLGIAVEDLRKLELAADLSGLTLETVARAVRNLNRGMVDFMDGTGEAVDAFEKLGITTEDVNAVMGNQFRVLELIADRLLKVENSAIRSAIAQDLFGGRASEMLLVLEDGSEGMRRISDEAERFGLVLSAKAARGVEDANDSFTRLFALLKGLRDQVMSQLAPAIEDGVNAVRSAIENIVGTEGGIKEFARSIAHMLIDAFEAFGNFMINLFNTMISVINTLIRGINTLNEKTGIFGGDLARLPQVMKEVNGQVVKFNRDVINIPPGIQSLATQLDILSSSQEFNEEKARSLLASLYEMQQRMLLNGTATHKTNLRLETNIQLLEYLIGVSESVYAPMEQLTEITFDFSSAMQRAKAKTDTVFHSLHATSNMVEVHRFGTDNLTESTNKLNDELSNVKVNLDDLLPVLDKNIKANEKLAAENERMQNAFGETIERGRGLVKFYDSTAEATAKSQIQIAKMTDGLNVAKTTGGEALKTLAEDSRDLNKNLEDVAVRGIKSLEDAMVSAITGTMKLKDAFKSMAASIISDIMRMYIRMQISAPIAQAMSSFFQTPTYAFGSGAHPGEKAMGGSVSAGRPYVVGEKGAELFIPGGSGTIIPNNQMGGGGVVVNQTVNLSTGVSQTVRAEVMNMLPQIADAAKGAVIDAKRRGGRFGTAFGV